MAVKLILVTNDINEANRVIIIRSTTGVTVDARREPLVLAYYINSHFTAPIPIVKQPDAGAGAAALSSTSQPAATGERPKVAVSLRPAPTGSLANVQHPSDSLTGTSSSSASAPPRNFQGARIIGMYNYKGGVGKTSNTINLGAALAMAGQRVLIIDADPQCNLTNFFHVDSNQYERTTNDPSLSTSEIIAKPPPATVSESVDRLQQSRDRVFSAMTTALDRLTGKQSEENVKLTWDRPHLKSGAVGANSVAHPLEPYQAPTLHSMLEFARNPKNTPDRWKPDAPQFALQQVYVQQQKSMQLYFLPGHHKVVTYEKYLNSARTDLSQDVPLRPATSAQEMLCFRWLVDHLSSVHEFDVVLVDLSPSSSLLNEMFVMSCDYVLPPSFGDRFSLSSALGFLHHIFPLWLERAESMYKKLKECSLKSDWDQSITIPSHLPFILPFLVTAHEGQRPPRENILWQQTQELLHWSAGKTSAEIEKSASDRRHDDDPTLYRLRPFTIQAAASQWIMLLEQTILDAPPQTRARYLPFDGLMVIPLIGDLHRLVSQSHTKKVPVVLFDEEIFLSLEYLQHAIPEEMTKIRALHDRLRRFSLRLLTLPPNPSNLPLDAPKVSPQLDTAIREKSIELSQAVTNQRQKAEADLVAASAARYGGSGWGIAWKPREPSTPWVFQPDAPRPVARSPAGSSRSRSRRQPAVTGKRKERRDATGGEGQDGPEEEKAEDSAKKKKQKKQK